MNVTPFQKCSQVITAFALSVCLAGGIVKAETHSNLQAVASSGLSAWSGPVPFIITGVLLTDPTEMLDPTPNFIPYNNGAGAYQMGAQWQILFQAVDSGDRGGTACYMGQCYGNMPWEHSDDLSYPNAAWTADILRLSYDPTTLHALCAGDLIQVTVRTTSDYGGKRNITEDHSIDTANNFDIALVTPKYGLPMPELLTLSDLKNADDAYIFDPTRATGGEHWQGMRVRINNLSLTTTNGWNATNTWSNRKCTAIDNTGRTFPLRTPRYSLGAAPAGIFDAIGVLNQESGSGNQGTNGYELFVQQVVPQAQLSLAIAQTLALTWPVTGASYQLEFLSDASTTNWISATNMVSVIDGQNTVLVAPMANASQFYRLRKTN